MSNKQEIIMRCFRDGKSISKIAKEVGVCRKTVREYIKAYTEQKKKLNEQENFDKRELIEDIVKAPKYDSSTREKRKITAGIESSVSECLNENQKKRSRGQHKQQMKKIDIFEYIQEKGFDIGYTSICNLINKMVIRQAHQPKNIIVKPSSDRNTYLAMYVNLTGEK